MGPSDPHGGGRRGNAAYPVSGLWRQEIKTALDVGAAGVMIPGIDSAKAARQAVALSKFPPVGRRGACPFVRANGTALATARRIMEKPMRKLR